MTGDIDERGTTDRGHGNAGNAGDGAADADGDESSGDLVFDTLWGRVLESWDDDKTHAVLLDYALRNERLPDAAGRYRALEKDPEKGERAKKRLAAIVLAATQMMMSMKTPPRPKTPPWMIILTFLVCLVLLAYLGYAMIFARARH